MSDEREITWHYGRHGSTSLYARINELDFDVALVQERHATRCHSVCLRPSKLHEPLRFFCEVPSLEQAKAIVENAIRLGINEDMP